MIPYEEALALVLAHAKPLGTEVVPLAAAVGRALAKPVRARHDMPAFDNSAVDGFAVRAEDVPGELRLAGAVQAGDGKAVRVRTGEAVKIMTGALLPAGATAVVMKEVCEERGATVLVKEGIPAGENIRRAGEEFRKGAAILPAGVWVSPPVVGVLASQGAAEAQVWRAPTVSVVSTGNELVPPGQPLKRGQIYESNSAALCAALSVCGVPVAGVERLKDDTPATRRALERCMARSDVVVTLGGVSVGEYDLVKAAAAELGVKQVFWRVAIKPGKPLFFGTYRRERGRGLFFGLPGNPVAALLCFNRFVKPALAKMLGLPDAGPMIVSATLSRDLVKKAGRLEWVRVGLDSEDGRMLAVPVGGQGSHMAGSLAQAVGLVSFPAGATRWRAGRRVEVELLTWNL